MGERLLCKQEVIGSIPFTSTRRVFIASGTGPQTRRLCVVLFFDMVNRECVAGRVKPFGSVSVFTREMRQAARAGFSPVRGGSCWRGAKQFALVRVNEGHLVDALAPRGDEGRGTLRKARMSREQALTPGSPNGATHRASGIPDRIHRSGRRTRRTETSQ